MHLLSSGDDFYEISEEIVTNTTLNHHNMNVLQSISDSGRGCARRTGGL